ncbi:MAG TPA: response regulator [Nocardioidaceae bacterium]|nr:response regulator [Nocardioidaceae bacterium]
MTAPPPRVLVVDDSQTIRDLISLNLELEGFDVVTAVDGQDCLEQVQRVRPDLVTLDVVMPRLDGFETAQRLKTDPATSHVAVMFVTASAQSTDLARGKEVGADAYLTKPFDPGELIATVRRLAG